MQIKTLSNKVTYFEFIQSSIVFRIFNHQWNFLPKFFQLYKTYFIKFLN